MSVLRVGDKVRWRGSWGANPAVEATVTNIVVGGKSGQDVLAVPWNGVQGREVVVDLDNGHWAYGSQITASKEGS